jgi:hypothetical protein
MGRVSATGQSTRRWRVVRRTSSQQTPASERTEVCKVHHPRCRTPAAGDTNSRRWVASCWNLGCFCGPSGSGESCFEPSRGNEARQRLSCCRASPICGVCEFLCESVSELLREFPRAHLVTWTSHPRAGEWGRLNSTTDPKVSRSHCWQHCCSVPVSSHPPAAATSFGGRCFRSVAQTRLKVCQRLPSDPRAAALKALRLS